MNQLTGKYVNVVLSVECGRGMDFLRNKVFITANFNSRVLESDHIPPDESPPFNTELVWEIEKKELRKIRCGNLPLRVECITVDSQNRKERIGFALLSLRSAQIIPQSLANQPVTPVWHKLIGCQADKRKSHPELYLSLSLRDHLITEQINLECEEMPFILEEENQVLQELTVTPKECPIKYFENGHIQIGDEEVAKNPFIFNLKVMEVSNLEVLLPKSLVFQANSGSYFLTFKILGIIIKSKPFQNQMYGNIILNEKIVVNLLSTKPILEDFFKTQAISISFYYGYDKLGVVKFNYDHIWDKIEERYFFRCPSSDGVVPHGSSEKSPYITLEAWIDEHPEAPKKEPVYSVCEETLEKPKARSIFSNVNNKSGGDIDIKSTYNTEEPEKLTRNKTAILKSRKNIILPFVSKSEDTVIISEDTTPRPSAVLNIYEKFIVLVSLKYITWLIPPSDTKIMFKFLHPKANSCTTIFTEIGDDINKEIVLSNIYVKMAYISTAEKIAKLLKYWNPKLVIADQNEEYITEQRPVNVNCLEDKSQDEEIEFTNLSTGTPLAKIGLNINLSVVDSRLEDDYETVYLLPVVLDEVIAINEISDLDKWKDEQKCRFLLELEKIKEKEKQELENEYEQKKVELQTKVTKTLEKCRNIKDQLKKKMMSLKFEKDLIRKRQGSDILYENKLQENLTAYACEDPNTLIELLSKTQQDNILLKQICEDQKEKLSKVNKSTVTKAQTSSLLQELQTLEDKFTEVRAAKSYFKEKLQEACEEIKDSKLDDDEKDKTKVEQTKEGLRTSTLNEYPVFYTEIDLKDDSISRS